MQMAAYANAKDYDQMTFKRSPLVFDGEPVNLEVGLLIHTPVEEGMTTVYRMDLVKGWDDVRLAAEVRAYRKFWNSKKSEFEIVREVKV